MNKMKCSYNHFTRTWRQRVVNSNIWLHCLLILKSVLILKLMWKVGGWEWIISNVNDNFMRCTVLCEMKILICCSDITKWKVEKKTIRLGNNVMKNKCIDCELFEIIVVAIKICIIIEKCYVRQHCIRVNMTLLRQQIAQN